MADKSDDSSIGGTIIRGSDGSLYFIRDDLLEAARVTEEDAIPFLNRLIDEGGKAGTANEYALRAGPAVVVSFEGPFSRVPGPPRQTVAYTSMCTGTMQIPADFTPRILGDIKK
jgi:hypothetical protein